MASDSVPTQLQIVCSTSRFSPILVDQVFLAVPFGIELVPLVYIERYGFIADVYIYYIWIEHKISIAIEWNSHPLPLR